MAVNPDLPHDLPYSLAVAAQAGSTLWANTNFEYEFAIGGLPFLGAISDQFPLDRESTDWQKNQVDTSQQPGEQTLSAWWLRSQESFHGGAGVKYYNPGNLHAQYFGYQDKGASAVMFAKSSGVDVWTDGQLSLLRDTTNKVQVGANGYVLSWEDASGNPHFVVGVGSTVYHWDENAASWSTVSGWGGTDTIVSAATDGTNAFWATATGIYKMPFATLVGTKIWNTGSANVVVGWVKQRLMAGVDNNMYELVTGGPTLPSPIYTDYNAAFTFTAITDGPDAIYASGFAGVSGVVLRFDLDTNAALPTLTAASVAAQLPYGEVPYTIATYLGAYVGLGTNKGIRTGLMDSAGNIQYGPLIVETTFPVRAVTGRDRFLWFGVQAGIDGASGLIRVDLSAEVEPLRMAYANDLVLTGSTAAVYSIASFGGTDRLVVGADGAWLEDASTLVASGYLQSGQVRFQTLEYKQFSGINLRGNLTDGSVTLSTVDRYGNVSSLVNVDGSVDLRQTIGVNNGLTDELGVHLQLYRDSGDSTAGPVLTGWQMKALPYGYNIGETLLVPLMLFDFEKDSNDLTTGYEGYAYDRFRSLKALEASGVLFQFQDLRTDERLTVRIDKTALRQQTPPSGRSTGFGGVVFLTLRQVVL